MYFDEENTDRLQEKKSSPRIGARIVVEGPKVQGVGYRVWLVSKAQGKVDGWVRNRANKTVEAVLVGDQRLIDEIIQACYFGPPMASVKKVKQFPYLEVDSIDKGFYQLPTT